MDYTKLKTVRTPEDTKVDAPKQSPDAPTPGTSFEDKDKFEGKAVDSNYATIPTDKQAIDANLKRIGEEIRTRFGLEERGVPVTEENVPNKP